jgi:hypothetical protein
MRVVLGAPLYVCYPDERTKGPWISLHGTVAELGRFSLLTAAALSEKLDRRLVKRQLV